MNQQLKSARTYINPHLKRSGYLIQLYPKFLYCPYLRTLFRLCRHLFFRSCLRINLIYLRFSIEITRLSYKHQPKKKESFVKDAKKV